MSRLWSADRPVLVREVMAVLREDREIAYTTVMTVLENLRRKGIVDRTKDGRAYRYQPRLSREEYAAALMEEVFADGGDRHLTLLHFMEQISPQDVAGLRTALNAAADDDSNPR